MESIKEEPVEFTVKLEKPESDTEDWERTLNDELAASNSTEQEKLFPIKIEEVDLKAENIIDWPDVGSDPLRDPLQPSQVLSDVAFENDRKTKNESSKTIKCPVCKKHYKRKDSLQAHLRYSCYSTSRKQLKCDYCQKVYCRKYLLVRHIQVIHYNHKPYICSYCEKSFGFKKLLQSHMWHHTGVKSYSCKVCSKTFVDKQALEHHMRSHTGVKPYSCDICSKSFAGRANIIRHLTSHTGEKPYVCSFCSKAFSNSSQLQKHKLIHTDQNRYSTCKFCSRKVRDRYLTIHVKKVHGEKTFSCTSCLRTYVDNSALKRHMKDHTIVPNFSI